jgi:hypothetical protein
VTRIDFFFDPTCPWTWLSSRWLVDAARHRPVEVAWRPLSLLRLKGQHDPTASSVAVHRVIAALCAAGRHDLSGGLYEKIGRETHDRGERLDHDLARRVAKEVASDWAAALDDESLDEAVAAATREAMDLAGPDVGSPVLALVEPRVGAFGPIVNPGPRGEAAGRLLDLVVEFVTTPGLLELKRGRGGDPVHPAP